MAIMLRLFQFDPSAIGSSLLYLTNRASRFPKELYNALDSASYRISQSFTAGSRFNKLRALYTLHGSASVLLISIFPRSDGIAISIPIFRPWRSCLMDPSRCKSYVKHSVKVRSLFYRLTSLILVGLLPGVSSKVTNCKHNMPCVVLVRQIS